MLENRIFKKYLFKSLGPNRLQLIWKMNELTSREKWFFSSASELVNENKRKNHKSLEKLIKWPINTNYYFSSFSEYYDLNEVLFLAFKVIFDFKSRRDGNRKQLSGSDRK